MGLSQSLKSSYFLLLLCTLNVCTFNSKPLEKESVLFNGGFPALYVLGDSLVDSGNNNYLPTKIQANFTPYGSDFEGGIPTGRFSNGKTIADYIAMYYELPLVPAYLGLSEEERNNISTGYNYASASCGILHGTGKAFGKCLSFSVQVNLLKTTVQMNLPKMFKTRTEIKKHMSESLFMIAIGVNDYAFFYKVNQTDATAFADTLLHKFLIQLTRLHKLGARKFLINNIKPLGCYPNIIAHTIPQGSCNDNINLAVTIFNTKLRTSLSRMKHLLRGTTFLYSDYFNFMLKVRGPSRNHESSNLVNSINPCCPSVYDGGLTTSCRHGSASCSVPNAHLFFDPFHPTQFANLLYAIECFHERSV